MNQAFQSAEDTRRFGEYLQSLRLRGRKEATLIAYSAAHMAFCRFWFSAENSPADLMKITGLDYAAWAAEERHIPRARAGTILDVPEVPTTRLGVAHLDPESFRRFQRTVEAFGSPRDQAVIGLLLSGLRISEVAGLRISDIEINTHRATISVRGEHVKRSSHRQVPLPRQARVALQQYLEQVKPQGHVFLGERGAMQQTGIYKLVRKYAKMAGCDLHPHTLRHQFAAQYLAANPGDLVGLQLLLGHADVSTTSKHYVRKNIEDLRGGVQRIES